MAWTHYAAEHWLRERGFTELDWACVKGALRYYYILENGKTFNGVELEEGITPGNGPHILGFYHGEGVLSTGEREEDM